MTKNTCGLKKGFRQPDIGDQINKNIFAPIITANKLSCFPDFNGENLARARPRSTRLPI